ncbi:MAG: hypothetical protein EA374_06330 [Acholeplasmatales bacterium]|nr:MAG: hypothetical protein EA374_06330 [Acholeplasmatales bacterium]
MILSLRPEVFGQKHLAGVLFVFMLIGFALYLLIRYRTRPMTVLKVSSILIIALEVAKYLYVGRERGHLPVHQFPFQLCSYSLYAMPLVAFGRKRWREAVLPFAFGVGMVAALLVFAYPITVLGNAPFWFPIEGDWLPFHSFIYHGVMLFFSLYLVLSKWYKPVYFDIVKAFTLLFIAVAVSGVMNVVLDTNYMFLQNPTGNPLAVIWNQHGRLWYFLSMVVVAFLLLGIVFLPFAKVQVIQTDGQQTLDYTD